MMKPGTGLGPVRDLSWETVDRALGDVLSRVDDLRSGLSPVDISALSQSATALQEVIDRVRPTEQPAANGLIASSSADELGAALERMHRDAADLAGLLEGHSPAPPALDVVVEIRDTVGKADELVADKANSDYDPPQWWRDLDDNDRDLILISEPVGPDMENWEYYHPQITQKELAELKAAETAPAQDAVRTDSFTQRAAGTYAADKSAQIDPTAHIEQDVTIGRDVKIGPGVVVRAGTTLEHGCELKAGVSIGPNCTVKEGATIHEHAQLQGDNTVGTNTVIESSIDPDGDPFGEKDTVLKPGASVGRDCVIGARTEMEAGATIGNGCRFPTGTRHTDGNNFGVGCTIGDGVSGKGNVSVGARATVEADVTLGDSSRVASGATVREGSTLEPKEEVPPWSVREADQPGGSSLSKTLYSGSSPVEGLHPDANADGATIGKGIRTSPGVTFAAGSTVGDRSSFGKNITVGVDTTIGNRVYVDAETSIGQGCQVADGCNIGPHCEIGNGVVMGKGAGLALGVHIGAGSTIGPGVQLPAGSRIGENTIIEAGARFEEGEIRTGKGAHLAPGHYGSGCDIGPGVRTAPGGSIGSGAVLPPGVRVETPTAIREGVNVPAGARLERAEEPVPTESDRAVEREVPAPSVGGETRDAAAPPAKTPAPQRPSQGQTAGAVDRGRTSETAPERGPGGNGTTR